MIRYGWLVWIIVALGGARGVPAGETGEAGEAARAAGAAATEPGLQRINEALGAWVRYARDEVQFLEIDLTAQRLRLLSGGAVLRECRLRRVVLNDRLAVDAALSLRIRRYRPDAPDTAIEPGPFDWEDVLAHAAADDCALYFDNGLILFGDAVWRAAGPPSAQLASRDLRALFEACLPGTPLVILPPGWREAATDEQ